MATDPEKKKDSPDPVQRITRIVLGICVVLLVVHAEPVNSRSAAPPVAAQNTKPRGGFDTGSPQRAGLEGPVLLDPVLLTQPQLPENLCGLGGADMSRRHTDWDELKEEWNRLSLAKEGDKGC
jgi:hypothetical protein